MTEHDDTPPELEARLAEMDRRLQDIQAEISPERSSQVGREQPGARANVRHEQPAPPAAAAQARPPSRPQTRGRPGPLSELPQTAPRDADPPQSMGALAGMQVRLVAAMRELLDGYETALVQLVGEEHGPARSERTSLRDASGAASGVTLSAGPFATVAAMHEFERALASLPGVRDVAVHGYHGTDRAIVEVELDDHG